MLSTILLVFLWLYDEWWWVFSSMDLEAYCDWKLWLKIMGKIVIDVKRNYDNLKRQNYDGIWRKIMIDLKKKLKLWLLSHRQLWLKLKKYYHCNYDWFSTNIMNNFWENCDWLQKTLWLFWRNNFDRFLEPIVIDSQNNCNWKLLSQIMIVFSKQLWVKIVTKNYDWIWAKIMIHF